MKQVVVTPCWTSCRHYWSVLFSDDEVFLVWALNISCPVLFQAQEESRFSQSVDARSTEPSTTAPPEVQENGDIQGRLLAPPELSSSQEDEQQGLTPGASIQSSDMEQFTQEASTSRSEENGIAPLNVDLNPPLREATKQLQEWMK